MYNSHRDLRCKCPLRPSPVDAFEQHRQLRPAQRNSSALGLGPDETPAFKPLGEQAKTIAVEPQQLHDVASAAAKYEDVSRVWLLLQYGLHLRAQSMEATTHIGHAGSDPDPGPRAKFDHLRRLSRIDRNNTGSAPHSTLIIARPGNSM